MSNYNHYYEQHDYFGKPYPELVSYFDQLDRNLKILDLGCGQGRDSLAISRLGFQVLAVDQSEVGISQLNQIANEEKLNVKGIVSDIKEVDIKPFDIILLDSMFHFYKKDLEQETQFLKKLLDQLKTSGLLILVVQESKKRIQILKSILEEHQDIILENETHLIYQEFNSPFYMMVLKKVV